MDRVPTLGAGVHGFVRRIGWSYGGRRRLQKVTSHSATTGGSVRGEIQYAYNDFDQVITEYQQHGAAVNTSTSPKVQYNYVGGTGNTTRRTSCTYPDGKVVDYVYASGAPSKLSRVSKLKFDSTDIVDYSYLGLNQVVIQKYVQPSTDVVYTLDHGTANAYAGMDRFDRIVDLQWLQSTTKLVWLKYGYDRASNRKYRRDEVARNNSAKFDELYTYDGLHRLTAMDRGELNGTNTALVGSATLTQDWTLDPMGNWNRFQQGVVSALDQTREHNPVNEITDIDKTIGVDWPTPVYDANGNSTSFPDPRSLTSDLTATYDAWNRLVKLEDGSGTVGEYQYDGLNRWITKTVPSLLGSVTRHAYFSDQWQVLEERTGSNSFADQQFVWGLRYVDDLVLRDRFDVGPGYDNRLYALQDALFSVVAITDATGSVKERFAYQPYGKSEELDPDFTAYSGTDYQWEYRFTGRELDLESGLQLNRNRYLHLELGRWISRDLIVYADGFSLYQYSISCPILMVDPFGDVSFFLRPTPILRPLPGVGTGGVKPLPPPPFGSLPNPPVPPAIPNPKPGEPKPVGPNPEHFPEPNPTRTKPWKYPETNSDCTRNKLESLNNDVNRLCNHPGNPNSYPAPSQIWSTWWCCDDLKDLKDKWDKCCEARRKRENQCFRGGDRGHQIQIAACEYQVSYAYYLLRYWECFGPPREVLIA